MTRSPEGDHADQRRSGRSRRFAVLDLGSTTFQLLVADADQEGSLTPVLRDRVVLNLGLVLAETGEIGAEVADRAAGAARRLRDVAVRSGARRSCPSRRARSATARTAMSSPRCSRRPWGCRRTSSTGAEEARLTFAGVRASVALDPGPALLLDLGGGSLEVALADEGGLGWGVSLPVGAGRLTGLLVHTDPPSRAEGKAVRASVGEAIERVAGDVVPLGVDRCVASGGTAGALARLLAARRWSTLPTSLNQFTVDVDRLKDLTNELAGLSLAQRLKLPGIDERRAELLPAGGWILTTAASDLGMRELVHSEWGLREGVILDALGLADLPAPEPFELRRRSVERLVRGWGEDPRHVGLVAGLAIALFDALADVLGLGRGDRELLALAARLHEIGTAISPAKYHKHGAYLVENAGLRGFDPEEIAVMASIVRFQRGKDPRPVYPPFAELGEHERDRAIALTAILRVAHAIGRGDEPETLEVAVTVGPDAVGIRAVGSTNPEAVVEEARSAGELLERLVGRRLEIDARPLDPTRGA